MDEHKWACLDLLIAAFPQTASCYPEEDLKREDHLARQLFRRAYVGRPQRAIPNACDRLDEKELQLAGLWENIPPFSLGYMKTPPVVPLGGVILKIQLDNSSHI